MANTDNFNTVTATTTAQKLIPSNDNRHSYMLINTGATTIYVGPTDSLTSANGIQLKQDVSLAEDGGFKSLYTGDIYVITASSTSDVRYWERIRGTA